MMSLLKPETPKGSTPVHGFQHERGAQMRLWRNAGVCALHPNRNEETMTTSAQKEQAERRALVGSTTATTFHQQAITQIELEQQGRHAALAKASVSGREPAVNYPRMPEGSPWAGDLVPPEPALGYAIEAQEVTGEPFEVAASLNTALPNHAGEAVAATTEEFPSSSSVGAADASTQQCLSPAAVGASAPLGLRRGRRL
jgi:hypothetical protein